jgi:dihydroxycyclohexadiene carboxylate dehydrogenase
MPAEFAGKVALVTGVGRVGQIGHAVAQGLGAAGARLVLADVNAAPLAERVREFAGQRIEAVATAGDLASPEGAKAAVHAAQDRFGGLDVVINVAGGLAYVGDFLALTPAVVDKELMLNVKTTLFVCQAALPVLVARGGGAIVNFASIAVVRPLAKMASYSAAKWAVAGLTRALAREFVASGVRINAVAPATVRTADNVAQMGADAKYLELDELVRAVLYLASDAARGITGQVLPVTGRDVA